LRKRTIDRSREDRPGVVGAIRSDGRNQATPNKLLTAVFVERKTSTNMTDKMNYTGGRRRGQRSAEEGFGESPVLGPVEQKDDHQAMLDQGLRLNRAFVSINDPLVREAIINLVVDAAKKHNGAEFRLAAGSGPKIAPPEAD
jgi:hypothetical protein